MKRPTCPKCGKPGMHKASNGQRPRWRCETNGIVCYQTTDPSKPVRDQAGRPAIPQNVKVLVLDIETFPLESYTWGIWEQNVGLEQIKTEATIASFGAKWLGKKELIFAHTGGRGAAEVRDDRILMPPLWNLLHKADMVVAQNGNAFDMKWINARLLVHGYGPYSPVKLYDTLLVAKRFFRFTSNKLAWQSKYLTDTPKDEHKKFPGFELWLECMKDNPAAWAEMKKYNLRDVVATEKLYLKQRAWASNHPNLGTYDWSLATVCPRCASSNVEADGYKTLQAGVYVQYHCLDCGAWSRGKEMMTDKETRKVKLTS